MKQSIWWQRISVFSVLRTLRAKKRHGEVLCFLRGLIYQLMRAQSFDHLFFRAWSSFDIPRHIKTDQWPCISLPCRKTYFFFLIFLPFLCFLSYSLFSSATPKERQKQAQQERTATDEHPPAQEVPDMPTTAAQGPITKNSNLTFTSSNVSCISTLLTLLCFYLLLIHSWHVYSQKNQDRVRRDEAKAEAEENQTQERAIAAVR